MATRVIDDTKLHNIAVAIQAKDNGGQMTVDEMPTRIENIPTGGGVKAQKVNFYDFKGNLAHSYTAAEAAELTELPEAPTIEGFTFQKWNWSLASVKTWLAKHENDNCELNVGGLYVTTDGHTRIYMHLREAELASLEMPFCIAQIDGTVTIDWGDNSSPETITAAGIYSHVWQVNQYPADVVIDLTYNSLNNVKIILGVPGNNLGGLFNNNQYYATCVEKVELGINIDFSTWSATFTNCAYLSTINIPNGVTHIGGYNYNNCVNLKFIVLPKTATILGNRTFYNCSNLRMVIFSNNLFEIGDSDFCGCSSLRTIILLDSIRHVDTMAFWRCYSVGNVIISNSMSTLDTGTFAETISLSSIAIPNNITKIGNTVFQNCSSLYFIDLTSFTDSQNIPTLANTNAFQGIPVQARFLVANQEMYDAFTTATNWSTYASKFVIEGA